MTGTRVGNRKWLRLSVETFEESADVIGSLLLDAGAQGTLTENVGRGGLVAVTAFFPDAGAEDRVRDLLSRMPGGTGLDYGSLTIKTSPVEEEDWATAWKRFFKPLLVGRRIAVRPSWEAYEPSPGQIVITLDPGMAFGTGDHPTTAMCVRYIEEFLGKGMRVADIGTGSGILAIASAMLGACHVDAVDTDPVAVDAATGNIERNLVSDRVSVARGDIYTLRGGDGRKNGRGNGLYDLIVANIISSVIVNISGTVRELLKNEGVFVCSGISRENSGMVEEALSVAGLKILDTNTWGKWRAYAAAVE